VGSEIFNLNGFHLLPPNLLRNRQNSGQKIGFCWVRFFPHPGFLVTFIPKEMKFNLASSSLFSTTRCPTCARSCTSVILVWLAEHPSLKYYSQHQHQLFNCSFLYSLQMHDCFCKQIQQRMQSPETRLSPRRWWQRHGNLSMNRLSQRNGTSAVKPEPVQQVEVLSGRSERSYSVLVVT
jgi:hypothetical protein